MTAHFSLRECFGGAAKHRFQAASDFSAPLWELWRPRALWSPHRFSGISYFPVTTWERWCWHVCGWFASGLLFAKCLSKGHMSPGVTTHDHLDGQRLVTGIKRQSSLDSPQSAPTTLGMLCSTLSHGDPVPRATSSRHKHQTRHGTVCTACQSCYRIS